MEGLLLFARAVAAGPARAVRARFGVLTGVFLVGYAIARSTGELFRQPDDFLGYLLGGRDDGPAALASPWWSPAWR